MRLPVLTGSAIAAAVLLSLGGVLASAQPTSRPADTNWPQFRGPRASGVADGFRLPTEWDVPSGKNVKWKTPIIGLGHSCPVIWGDRLFVTTAVSGQRDPSLRHGLYGDIESVHDDTEHTWHVICLDKNTGAMLWEHEAYSGVPKIKRHTKATHANSTAATDGRHVVAFFGSEGLYCYDMDGKLKWKKDLGTLDSGYYEVPEAQWEFGSSPILYRDMVILQCDVQKDSFIAAFAVDDGRELWRTPRDEVPTWSTPTIVEGPGRVELVANGYKRIAGYDPATGKELWHMTGLGDIPTPTPIFAHDLIFLHSAHGRGAPIYAVRPGASGDIALKKEETTNEHVAWSRRAGAPYMPTAIAYGDYYYAGGDGGVLTCYNPKTGEQVYRQRIVEGQGGAFTASPVAGDGKLYFTSEDGDIFVVKAGPQLELLATNAMGEVCMATPAISGGVIYFRTKDHVVAVGE